MVSDKELDDFLKDSDNKDVTQIDKIDEKAVEQSLGEMGFLWDAVNKKLKEDGVCFGCKKEVDITSEPLYLREASKTDKGVIAFVGLCQDCVDKIKEEKENAKRKRD